MEEIAGIRRGAGRVVVAAAAIQLAACGGSGGGGGSTGTGNQPPTATVKIGGATSKTEYPLLDAVRTGDPAKSYGIYIHNDDINVRVEWSGMWPNSGETYTKNSAQVHGEFCVLEGTGSSGKRWCATTSFAATIDALYPAGGTISAVVEENDSACCSPPQTNPITLDISF